MRLKMKNKSHKYDIVDLGLNMDTNILNIKYALMK